MYDEIMQELWPKFEQDVKKYAVHGPYLTKAGWGECKKEALSRLKKYARLAKSQRNTEEFKRLVFREMAIFVFMLFHIRAIHKTDCGCSYCYLFRKLLKMFYEGSKKGKQFFFFDTARNYDGDVGFRLSNFA